MTRERRLRREQGAQASEPVGSHRACRHQFAERGLDRVAPKAGRSR